MGTVLEGDWDDVAAAVRDATLALHSDGAGLAGGGSAILLWWEGGPCRWRVKP